MSMSLLTCQWSSSNLVTRCTNIHVQALEWLPLQILKVRWSWHLVKGVQQNCIQESTLARGLLCLFPPNCQQCGSASMRTATPPPQRLLILLLNTDSVNSVRFLQSWKTVDTSLVLETNPLVLEMNVLKMNVRTSATHTHTHTHTHTASYTCTCTSDFHSDLMSSWLVHVLTGTHLRKQAVAVMLSYLPLSTLRS